MTDSIGMFSGESLEWGRYRFRRGLYRFVRRTAQTLMWVLAFELCIIGGIVITGFRTSETERIEIGVAVFATAAFATFSWQLSKYLKQRWKL